MPIPGRIREWGVSRDVGATIQTFQSGAAAQPLLPVRFVNIALRLVATTTKVIYSENV